MRHGAGLFCVLLGLAQLPLFTSRQLTAVPSLPLHAVSACEDKPNKGCELCVSLCTFREPSERLPSLKTCQPPGKAARAQLLVNCPGTCRAFVPACSGAPEQAPSILSPPANAPPLAGLQLPRADGEAVSRFSDDIAVGADFGEREETGPVVLAASNVSAFQLVVSPEDNELATAQPLRSEELWPEQLAAAGGALDGGDNTVLRPLHVIEPADVLASVTPFGDAGGSESTLATEKVFTECILQGGATEKGCNAAPPPLPPQPPPVSTLSIAEVALSLPHSPPPSPSLPPPPSPPSPPPPPPPPPPPQPSRRSVGTSDAVGGSEMKLAADDLVPATCSDRLHTCGVLSHQYGGCATADAAQMELLELYCRWTCRTAQRTAGSSDCPPLSVAEEVQLAEQQRRTAAMIAQLISGKQAPGSPPPPPLAPAPRAHEAVARTQQLLAAGGEEEQEGQAARLARRAREHIARFRRARAHPVGRQ